MLLSRTSYTKLAVQLTNPNSRLDYRGMVAVPSERALAPRGGAEVDHALLGPRVLLVRQRAAVRRDVRHDLGEPVRADPRQPILGR